MLRLLTNVCANRAMNGVWGAYVSATGEAYHPSPTDVLRACEMRDLHASDVPGAQLSDAAMRRVVRGTEADYDKETPKRATAAPLRTQAASTTTDLGGLVTNHGNESGDVAAATAPAAALAVGSSDQLTHAGAADTDGAPNALIMQADDVRRRQAEAVEGPRPGGWGRERDA